MRLIENNWGRVRCPKCDSVMDSIMKDDIRDSDDGHYIVCPVCGSRIWFNDEYGEHPVIGKILSGQLWHK